MEAEVVPLYWLALLPAFAHIPIWCATATTTETLSAALGPAGKLSVPSTLVLTHIGTTFASFSGTASISHKIRTTSSMGSGTITLQATGEFSPGSGPLVGNGDLTYSCSGGGPWTACSGQRTVSKSTQTPVLSIPAGACSGTGCAAPNPNTVSVTFSLTDSPTYSTGTYTVPITFTISAL